VLAQQVLGGHGYIGEWGMEQIVRDARIAQIYEGANGVQALDLIGRKLLRNGGDTALELIDEMREACVCATLQARFHLALDALVKATDSVLERSTNDPALAGAVSTDYLALCGVVLYAWLWGQMAAAAPDDEFGNEKRLLAECFFARLLPRHLALAVMIETDSSAVMDFPQAAF
jgi:hypothetical protein